jgi:hypothetical protein
LAQERILLNNDYEDLHHIHLIRQIKGVEKGFGYERYEFRYQNIIENVSLLDDDTVRELNQVIVVCLNIYFKLLKFLGLMDELSPRKKILFNYAFCSKKANLITTY